MLYIFDVEGVLLDSKDAVRYAAEKVRKRQNIDLPISEKDLTAVLSGTLGMTDLLVAPNSDGKSRRDALMLFGRHLDDVLPRFVQVYPKVPETLAKLKQEGNTLVAFSNRITLFLYQWLYDTQLISYFDQVVGVDAIPEELPSAKAVEYILARTQTNPKDAILLSDSIPELHSAALAGIAFRKLEYGVGVQGWEV